LWTETAHRIEPFRAYDLYLLSKQAVDPIGGFLVL
jgi:hypothetical protein